ncbi:MAG: hypothetical protein OHK0017_00010 [Patescibacteria group bacterium]
MKSNLENTLKNLPDLPGVYRFYDAMGNLLYVGKAISLRNRVRSYFQNSTNLLETRGQRIELMVAQVDRIDFTVVNNERESLLLEANLIHSLQPKYNVNLKDDKAYTFVRVNIHDPIPTPSLVRQKYDPRSVYFGPYTRRANIEDILRTIRQIFPYCQERRPTGKPCFFTKLHQCDGICAGLETREDYMQKINQIINILSGKTNEVQEFIQQKIMEAVELQNYALASLWRDRLQNLSRTIQEQQVVLSEPRDLDVITLILENQEDGKVIASLFYESIRKGKINNVLNYLLNGTTYPSLKSDNSQSVNQEYQLEIDSDTTNANLLQEFKKEQNNLETEFISKFFLSFYYRLADLPNHVYLQVFWKHKDSLDLEKYTFQNFETDTLQELLPTEVRLVHA